MVSPYISIAPLLTGFEASIVRIEKVYVDFRVSPTRLIANTVDRIGAVVVSTQGEPNPSLSSSGQWRYLDHLHRPVGDAQMFLKAHR